MEPIMCPLSAAEQKRDRFITEYILDVCEESPDGIIWPDEADLLRWAAAEDWEARK